MTDRKPAPEWLHDPDGSVMQPGDATLHVYNHGSFWVPEVNGVPGDAKPTRQSAQFAAEDEARRRAMETLAVLGWPDEAVERAHDEMLHCGLNANEQDARRVLTAALGRE